MSRIYELPTHLQVEDVLIAGLTARQLVRLMVGASLGYGLWDQAVWLPQELRFSLAVAIAVTGLLVALVQPGGRPARSVAAGRRAVSGSAPASGVAD